MFDFSQISAMGQLRITRYIFAVLHSGSRYSQLLELLLRCVRAQASRPVGDDLVESLAIPLSRRQSRKVVVFAEVDSVYRTAQGAPVLISFAGDCYPAIIAQGRIHAMRRIVWVCIAHPLIDASVRGAIKQRRGKKMQRRLRLRLIDILALAGAPSIVERRYYRDRSKAWSNVIRVCAEWPGAGPTRPSAKTVKACYRRG